MYGSHIKCVVMGMVFNATFNNISVISVKQTGSADVKSVASHCENEAKIKN